MEKQTAILVLETLTGYLFENKTLTEYYVGELPDYLPHAPVDSMTITDLKPDPTVEYTDYSFHPDGRIVVETIDRSEWKIEYTAGFDGLQPYTNPDPDANYAPKWAEVIVDRLTDISFDLQDMKREKLGEYEYEIRDELSNKYPNLMSIINLNRRLIV